jgi:uncharacterized protein
MEEILASIRRIIADDDAAKPQPRAADPAANAEPAMRVVPATKSRPAAPPTARTAPTPPEEMDAMLAAVDADREVEEEEEQAEPEPPGVPRLTEDAAAATFPKPSGARKAERDHDLVLHHVSPSQPSGPVAAPSAPTAASTAPLLSPEATASVNSAFSTLAHSIPPQNPRTLDDVVKETLRPMLKAWLDDNLPSLVERLVRAEIERMTRRHPG